MYVDLCHSKYTCEVTFYASSLLFWVCKTFYKKHQNISIENTEIYTQYTQLNNLAFNATTMLILKRWGCSTQLTCVFINLLF